MNRNDELIYTREVEHRILELERMEELETHEKDELIELLGLRDDVMQIAGKSSWTYGITLVRDHYFETHAKNEAEGLGLVSNINDWPANHIDWEQAADELKQDYSTIDYQGACYYVPR